MTTKKVVRKLRENWLPFAEGSFRLAPALHKLQFFFYNYYCRKWVQCSVYVIIVIYFASVSLSRYRLPVHSTTKPFICVISCSLSTSLNARTQCPWVVNTAGQYGYRIQIFRLTKQNWRIPCCFFCDFSLELITLCCVLYCALLWCF